MLVGGLGVSERMSERKLFTSCAVLELFRRVLSCTFSPILYTIKPRSQNILGPLILLCLLNSYYDITNWRRRCDFFFAQKEFIKQINSDPVKVYKHCSDCHVHRQ